MAIFSKKVNTEVDETKVAETTAVVPASTVPTSAVPTTRHERKQAVILIPRLSEKAYRVVSAKKYVFTVASSINKVEVRKAVEQQFGVKVASVNMVHMKGKYRTYGRISGRTSDYKKAIVTLTPDSKQIETAEVASA